MGNGERSKSEERAIQKKGGINSGKSRKRKSNLRKMAKELLTMEISPKQSTMRAVMKSFGIEEDDMNYGMSILAMQLLQASNGNTEAAKFLRDTAGENPAVQVKEKELKLERDKLNYQKDKDAGIIQDVEDDGFLKALEGKTDNSDWNESK